MSNVTLNPITPPRPANRGKTGCGERGVDLNAAGQPPAIGKRKRKQAKR